MTYMSNNDILAHSSYFGFLIPNRAWCWYNLIHMTGQFVPVNVGQYTSTTEHMGITITCLGNSIRSSVHSSLLNREYS